MVWEHNSPVSDVTARLAGFDAVVHIDGTRAVEPLERAAGWEVGERPETYPSAL